MIDKHIRQLVSDFLCDTPSIFSMDDFCIWAEEQNDVAVEDISLPRAEFFFLDSGYLTRNSMYFERGGDFFTDVFFVIFPTEEETESGKLIPGHRFLPFLDKGVHPRDCQLTCSDGFTIDKETTEFPLSDLDVYFTLFNDEDFIPYLQDENPELVEVLMTQGMDSPIVMSLTTFDIAGWWREYKLPKGTGMFCKVIDTQKGFFEVTPFLEHQSNEKAYIKAMDIALEAVIDKYHVCFSPDIQFALALYRIPKKYLLHPAMNLGRYLWLSKQISLIGTSGRNSVLGNEKPPKYENFSGYQSELDKYLNLLEIALSEEEIEALMRDEHYSGNPSMDNALDRCFHSRNLQFQDAEEEFEFFNLLEELWDYVDDNYNVFADRERGPLRKQLLAISDDTLKFIRSLNPDPEKYQALAEPLEELARNSAFLVDLLTLLNTDVPLSPGEHSQLSGLVEQVSRFQVIHDSMIDDIKQLLDQSPEKTPKEEPAEYYQFKISLMGIRPPVWRRVILPAHYSLGKLHEVIQITMGWDDDHLHNFEVGSVLYENPEYADDFFGYQHSKDENETPLDRLGLYEKDHFIYTYDFGDNWRHKIALEKILTPHEAVNKDSQPVICLKAKRASPPEDCGGAPGYFGILELLSDPDHPEFEELAEWLDPNFNPEFTDLYEINEILKDEFE